MKKMRHVFKCKISNQNEKIRNGNMKYMVEIAKKLRKL